MSCRLIDIIIIIIINNQVSFVRFVFGSISGEQQHMNSTVFFPPALLAMELKKATFISQKYMYSMFNFTFWEKIAKLLYTHTNYRFHII